ncbi:hypothetical protein PIB30_090863 [Stylosanthes scabra]|uniref:Uncharacterized protein n=1 Tax=Stylosanthes scabra TaxID=79078 RepID=A0ABU6SV80_9FABA|nr:hypothetical protein [Stylosanthes scabra]
MTSTSKRRRGKAPAADFDEYRFKSLYHEELFQDDVASKDIIPETRFRLGEGQYPKIQHQINLRGKKRLRKPPKEVGCSLVQEFYTNARLSPGEKTSRYPYKIGDAQHG